MTAADRFRPVVAVDVDGVLRLMRSDADGVDAFSAVITMDENHFPVYAHGQPPWDENGKWTYTHWFTRVGVTWLQSLVERGVEVVWATTWQEHANRYFAPLFEIGELPLGVHGPGRRDEESATWKARNLLEAYPGRPLLWIDDNPIHFPASPLDRQRASRDRVLTRFQLIEDPRIGITERDIAEMEEFLTLATTEEGHTTLRARRRRDLARARSEQIRRAYGTRRRYRRWKAIYTRVRAVTPDSAMIPHLVADFVVDNPDRDPGAIVRLVGPWLDDETPTLEEIIRAAYGDQETTP